MKDLAPYSEAATRIEEITRHQGPELSKSKQRSVIVLTNSLVVDDPNISHWIAVREIAHELCSSGAHVQIIDINHKAPCALINNEGTETLVPYPRKEGSSAELTQQLRDAIALDERFQDASCDGRVLLGAEHDHLPETEAIMFAVDELQAAAQSARCVFVTGGIFQPYKIEPFLQQLDTRLIYYAMNFRNDSRYRHIYSVCLSTLPETTERFWDAPVVQRPTYVGTPAGCADELNPDSENVLRDLTPDNTICVACTRHLAVQLSRDYLDALHERLLRSPDSRFLAIGITAAALTSHIEKTLGAEALHAIESQLLAIPFERNLSYLFDRLARFRACFMNPESPGNGGSILFSAQAGLPTLVAGANDAKFVCAALKEADLSSHTKAFEVLDKCLRSDAYRAHVLETNAKAVLEAKLYANLLFGLAWKLS